MNRQDIVPDWLATIGNLGTSLPTRKTRFLTLFSN
jgi:hypothetical protein